MTPAPHSPKPHPGALTAPAVGDSGSAAALRRLGGQLSEAKGQALQPILRQALSALRAGRRDAAAAAALKALDIDSRSGLAWHILAICREKAGDFTQALKSYEQAFALTPDEPEIANDLGRLALKMGMAEIAEALFANYVARRPGSVEGINNLACAQRDRMDFERAIETLKGGIQATPASALLWNALASVLTLQGEMQTALVFYDEALRLDPPFAAARCNRSAARLALGNTAGAVDDLDIAIAQSEAAEAATMKVARAKALLASGDLAAGWAAYGARLDPHCEDATHFVVDRPAWAWDDPLDGRRILLVGEQGLGDEVLFAHAVQDVIDAVGGAGGVTLAVNPRLTSLFARAFPGAEVVAHATHQVDHLAVRSVPLAADRMKAIDAWAPLGAPLRRFRARPEDFRRGPFLRADPSRVEAWRGRLAALPGLKAGLLWKSLIMDADRLRHFAPFADWRPVLQTPRVTFVTLQYGDIEAETEAAAALGVTLWTPPGIDLKDDLDDVAALTCALDLTIGPANATTNIAAACGAAVWLISTPWAWPRLGQADYPWYPQARVFTPDAFARWEPAMQAAAEALGGLAKG